MIGDRDSAILEWIGRLGAVSCRDVAARFELAVRMTEGSLRRLVRAELLLRCRVLHGRAPLYVATRAGLRLAGLGGLSPCRVSPASFAHWSACARVARFLEFRSPGRVMSERELRYAERAAGNPIATIELGRLRGGEYATHRPDLVVWEVDRALPLAVEVELTVKAPRRLEAICRAWARSRRVDGVVYFASPAVEPPLARVIAALQAEQIISVLPLERAAGDPPRSASSGG